MTLLIDTLYFSIVFVVLAYTFLSYLLSKVWRLEQRPPARKLQHHRYEILVPCVDEAAVIRGTIQSLLALNFDGEIIVIDDGSRDQTAAIVRQFQDPRVRLFQRHQPHARQGKGAALNDALRHLLQRMPTPGPETILGVVDADGRLTPNTFSRLDQDFSDQHIAAVQLRVKMNPEFKNGLQASQDLEFFTVNNRTQLARNYSHTVGLSGNGQFFRLQPVIDALGDHPWGHSLLDDYELTIKLMLHNLQIGYEEQAYVYQQAISQLGRFVKQRSRWVQGNLECQKYLPQVIRSRKLGLRQKLGVLYFLLQPYLNLAADLLIVVMTAIFLHNCWTLIHSVNALAEFLFLIGALYLASILWGAFFTNDYLKDLRRHHEPRPTLRYRLSLPLWVSYVYLVLFFSIVIAFGRQLVHHTSWLKTARETSS